jgi:hypothetical protein
VHIIIVTDLIEALLGGGPVALSSALTALHYCGGVSFVSAHVAVRNSQWKFVVEEEFEASL